MGRWYGGFCGELALSGHVQGKPVEAQLDYPQASMGIVCQNCGHHTHVPSAMRQKVPRLLLACPSCEHVYEYELPPYPVGLRECRDSRVLILRPVAFECSDSECKFPVAVHTVLYEGIDAKAELTRRRTQWIFHGTTCPFGHPLQRLRD